MAAHVPESIESKSPKKPNLLLSNLIVSSGSALANFFSDSLCYPLDTINTWIKTSSRKDSIPSLVRSHISKDGFKVLFRGINTQFYGVFFPSFLYFSCYEITNRLSRKLLERTNMEHYSKFIPTLTASVSEALSLLLIVPIDAVKTRYQLNTEGYRYSSVVHGVSDIIKKEGFLRLFLASPMYMVNLMVWNTLLFQTYEILRINQMHREKKEGKDLTLIDSLQHTLVATAFATFVTNPLDLILTRYQVVDSSKGELSFKKIVRDVYKTDGWRGLNRGVWFKVAYRCIDTCIYLPIYEELRKRYGEDFAKSTD